MGFFTPEFFNTIIVINLVVGVLLISVRFYQDMKRDPTGDEPPDGANNPDPTQQPAQRK